MKSPAATAGKRSSCSVHGDWLVQAKAVAATGVMRRSQNSKKRTKNRSF